MMRFHDSQLEHRVAVRMAAAEAANLCSTALANNAELAKWANFETCQLLKTANISLAYARHIYETIATMPPQWIDLHPALEAQLRDAGEFQTLGEMP